MISPSGDVYLGTVPWNKDYKHIYEPGLGNPSAVLAFLPNHTSNYTFIREDSNIRVPYNADTLYGINYCGYQNDGKWFFAFVTTVTYVSNNTTLLHLVEDIWQTWGEYLVWKACLVQREHVSSDALGQWRAPEPSMSLESVIVGENDFNTLSYNAVVIGTNAIPHLKAGVGGTIFSQHTEADFDGSDPVSGGYYNTIFSGAKYYGFTFSQSGAFINFLNNLNLCGAAESICTMFMVPSSFLQVGSDYAVTGYASGGIDEGFSAPQTLGGGYSPRNKKCLTYPYAYAVITDHSGGEMDVKYEDCNTWGAVNYRFQQGLDATAQIFLTLTSYMGQALDTSHMMPIAQNPQCSWVYSAYQNWAAQNSAVIQNKQNWNMLGMAGGLLTTVAGALLFSTGIGAPAGGTLGALGLTSMEAAGATMALSGLGAGMGALRSQTGIMADIDAQSKTPNQRTGSSSGNSLQGIAHNEGGYRCVALQAESARRLDAFFDVFGYEVDIVKIPNVTGRPNWNYVKTVGANMTGTIPSDRLAAMNAHLDAGVTFWHTASIGNYALANGV